MIKQRFIKPKIDKYIQLYSRNAKLEEVNSSGILTDLILTEKGYWYLYPPDITFTGGGGSGATAEAIVDNEYNLDLTSLKLTNEGTNYISQPSITITPQPAIDGISSIPILTGGIYTEVPTIYISGKGGAIVTANLSKTSVTGVNVTFGGSGYQSIPSVYFPPPSAGGIQAAGVATVVNGVITRITMTNIGSNYLTTPNASFSGALFTLNAICAPPTMGGPVTNITISNQGSQYDIKPTVSLVRSVIEREGFGVGNYAGTLGTPVLTRYIYDIFITKGGSGYTDGSVVNFTGGNPSVAAVATAIVTDGVVVGVNITNNGSGYTSAPTAQFTGGTGASGTPIIHFGIYATARAKMAKAGHRVYKYVWDLDEPIDIDENAILSVCDRQFTIQNRDMGEPDVFIEKPIVIRIHEVGTKSIVNAKNLPTNNFFSGKIIDIGKPNRLLPNDIKLELNSQTINRIVLSLDYDISRRTGFIKDDEFVIILKIAEKEPSILEYGSLNNINTTQ